MSDHSLIHILLRAACAQPDRVALQGETLTLTYGQLHEQAQQLAGRLRQQGLVRADPVLLKSSNHPLDFVAMFAVWLVGAVVVPVHRSAPAAIVDAIQSKAKARFLIDRVLLASEADADSVQVVTLAMAPIPEPERAQRATMLRDAALVIFTSGSTGLPKGVVLSHAAFAGKLEQNQRIFHFTEQDVTLLVLNNTFSFGIWMALLTLMHGGVLVTRERFAPQTFLDTLHSERITRVGVVPTMIRATFGLLNLSALQASQEKLRAAASLREVVIGGEPLGLALSVKLRAFIAPAMLYDVYGLTETSTSDFVLAPDDYPEHPDTIGKPAAAVRFRITNDGTNECAVGEPGELQLQTPYLMNGYLGDEALTLAAFDRTWFRTGDLASQDDQGFVTIVGRLKELIVRGANKITPIEVERALCACSSVAAALVVGSPDPILGQRIHALLIPVSGQTIHANTLRAELTTRLEKFKHPDVCYLGEELPTGRTGKIDRGQLQAFLSAGALPTLASWSNNTMSTTT